MEGYFIYYIYILYIIYYIYSTKPTPLSVVIGSPTRLKPEAKFTTVRSQPTKQTTTVYSVRLTMDDDFNVQHLLHKPTTKTIPVDAPASQSSATFAIPISFIRTNPWMGQEYHDMIRPINARIPSVLRDVSRGGTPHPSFYPPPEFTTVKTLEPTTPTTTVFNV